MDATATALRVTTAAPAGRYGTGMLEVLVIAGLAAAVALRVAVARRAALRRARLRAEAVLDELAGAACDALAADDRSRRSARAVDRYAHTRDRVAAARTCSELDVIVARHQLRMEAQRPGGPRPPARPRGAGRTDDGPPLDLIRLRHTMSVRVTETPRCSRSAGWISRRCSPARIRRRSG